MANLYMPDNPYTGGGYLTPRFGSAAGRAMLQGTTQAYLNYGGTTMEQKPDEWWHTVGGSVAAAPLDVVDSLAALTPWAERGELNDAVYNTIPGMSSVGQWVRDNHGSVEVASGLMGFVVGAVGVEMATAKLLGSAWFASTGLGTAVNASRWTVANAQRSAAQAMQVAARSGQPYRWYQSAEGTQYAIASAANVAGRTAVSEATMMAALSQNSFIWSDDMSDNFWNFVIGVGVGGAIGGVMARGQIQKWANSPEITRILEDVYDPTGLERGMTKYPLSGGNAYSIRDSAEVTANAIIARRDTTKFGNVGDAFESQATIQSRREAEVQRGLQRLATKGVNDVTGTSFNITAAKTPQRTTRQMTPAGRHLDDAIKSDPTLIYGLDELGVGLARRSATEIETLRKSKIAETLASKAATRIEKEVASNRQNQTAAVLLDKSWVPPRVADEYMEYVPNKVVAKPTSSGISEMMWTSPNSGKKLILNEQGKLNHAYETLSVPERLETAEAATQWMTRMKQRKETMVLPADPDWYQLDLAVEFGKRGGDIDFSNLGPEILTTDQLQVMSLAKKYEHIKDIPELDFATRDKFNLPKATSFEQNADPQGMFLKNISKAAAVPKATLEQLKEIRAELRKAFDLVEEVRVKDELDGDMFRFNRAEDGTWYEPVVGFFDSVPAAKWSKFDLQEQFIESQAATHFLLTGNADKAPFSASLANAIEAHPNRGMAKQVVGMHDNQLQSTANFHSQAASQFLTAAHKNRNVPALLAAQRVGQDARRFAEQHLAEQIQPLTQFSDAFKSAQGRKSAILLNQYMSHVNAWDIAEATQLPDGMWAFKLDKKSEINRDWLGRYAEDDEYLRNPTTGNIIVLDDMANAARVAMQSATDRMLDEVNSLRIATGMKPVPKRPFWVPPQSTEGKIVGFTLDTAGNVVRGKAIVASTQEEYNRIAAEIRKSFKPEDGYRIYESREIRDYVGKWEEMGLDFIDPTSITSPSRKRKGTLATDRINPRAWDDGLKYLHRGYQNLTRSMLEEKFSAPIAVARVRSAAIGTQKTGVKNIFDTYVDTLLGRSATSNPVGLNMAVSPIEKMLDQSIKSIWPKGNMSSNHLGDMYMKMGIPVKSAKSMEELLDLTKDHIPFAHIQEYLRHERGIKEPPTMRGMSQWLNKMGSGMILRWGELAHSVMNMLGVITNMPAILGARNVPLIGKVKGVPIVDSAKIMGLSFQDMLSRRSHPDWEYMVQQGYASDVFAHMHMQMSTIDSHGSFMRLMVGDPALAAKAERKHKGARTKYADSDFWRGKGIEGVVSAFTDTSENLARVWSHFVGLRLADYQGITGLKRRHHFAKQIADDGIANYDPMNRPEIFQSAFGNMYGLFLSYQQAYYQRLFRYMEDADYNALGRNMAVQASLFGINSLPGSRQYAAFMGGEEEGDGFLDGIYRRFGPAAGSVVANGGFNQITTLFNAIPGVEVPAIAIHSRGDINFRHPTADSLLSGRALMPVGMEILQNLSQAFVDTVGATINPDVPMSGRHAAEIISRHMPNRVLKGMMVMAATGGQEADAYGQMMAETQGFAEGLYRAFGLRSARQQAEIEAYFLNRQADAIEAVRMDKVRVATRALIREGNFDRLPEVFEDYLAAGGQPWNYERWIRTQIEEAGRTRTQNQLLSALRNPANQLQAQRILQFTGAY